MQQHRTLIARIDAVLPQTQCGQCGHDGCLPYATAIACGEADIDQCPPGGESGVARIAAVVGRAPIPLNPDHGAEKPLALAVIDEAQCIGCTLCIQACPVDAIAGAAKRMHDVIAELCTGCELCVPPCPVDCIRMVPAGFVWDDAHAADAKLRFEARNRRLVRDQEARPRRTDVPSDAVLEAPQAPGSEARRKAIIAAAIARARLKREAKGAPNRGR